MGGRDMFNYLFNPFWWFTEFLYFQKNSLFHFHFFCSRLFHSVCILWLLEVDACKQITTVLYKITSLVKHSR